MSRDRLGSDTRRTFKFFAASIVILVFAAPAGAAPQTFNTALAIAKGEWIARGQFYHRRATGDPSPMRRELSVLGGIAVGAYGLARDLAVFAVVPFLDKSLELTLPSGQRIRRNTTGVGDVRVFGRYTVFQDDAPGRTFRVALFGGVETPTGDDDDRDALGTLPAPLQLGSGSWDLFFGTVATYQTLQYQVDAQISYQLNTAAHNFQFGDELRFDASFQYRLWPRKLGPGVPGFLYGVVELNLLHQGRNRIGGLSDPNSGGTTVMISPGVQYVTRRWVLEAIVQLPVLQDLNGMALRDDFTLRVGFRVNF